MEPHENNNHDVSVLLPLENTLGITAQEIDQAVDHLRSLHHHKAELLAPLYFGKLPRPLAQPTSPRVIIDAYKHLISAFVAFKEYQFSMFALQLPLFEIAENELNAAKARHDIVAYLAAFNYMKDYRFSCAFRTLCQHLEHIIKCQEAYFVLLIQSRLFICQQYGMPVIKTGIRPNDTTKTAQQWRDIEQKVDADIAKYQKPIQSFKNPLISLATTKEFNDFTRETARLFSCPTHEVFSWEVLNSIVKARAHQEAVFQCVKHNTQALFEGSLSRVFVKSSCEPAEQVKQQIIFYHLWTKLYQSYYLQYLRTFIHIKKRYTSLLHSLHLPFKQLSLQLNDLTIAIADSTTAFETCYQYFDSQYHQLITQSQQKPGYVRVVQQAKRVAQTLLEFKKETGQLKNEIHQWHEATLSSWHDLDKLYTTWQSFNIDHFLTHVKTDISLFILTEFQLQQSWLERNAQHDELYSEHYHKRIEHYFKTACSNIRLLKKLKRTCSEKLHSNDSIAIGIFYNNLQRVENALNDFIQNKHHAQLLFHDTAWLTTTFKQEADRDQSLVELIHDLLTYGIDDEGLRSVNRFEQSDQSFLQKRLDELCQTWGDFSSTKELHQIIITDITARPHQKMVRLDRWLKLMLMAWQKNHKQLSGLIYHVIQSVCVDLYEFMFIFTSMTPRHVWPMINDLYQFHAYELLGPQIESHHEECHENSLLLELRTILSDKIYNGASRMSAILLKPNGDYKLSEEFAISVSQAIQAVNHNVLAIGHIHSEEVADILSPLIVWSQRLMLILTVSILQLYHRPNRNVLISKWLNIIEYLLNKEVYHAVNALLTAFVQPSLTMMMADAAASNKNRLLQLQETFQQKQHNLASCGLTSNIQIHLKNHVVVITKEVTLLECNMNEFIAKSFQEYECRLRHIAHKMVSSVTAANSPVSRNQPFFNKYDFARYEKIRTCREMTQNPVAHKVLQAQKVLIHNRALSQWIIAEHRALNVYATATDFQLLNDSLRLPTSKKKFIAMLSKVMCSKVTRNKDLEHIYYLSKQSYYRGLLDNSVLKNFVENTVLKSQHSVWLRFLFRGTYGTESKIHNINQALYDAAITKAAYTILLKQVGIDLSQQQLDLVWQHHEKLLGMPKVCAQNKSFVNANATEYYELPCRSQSSFLSGICHFLKGIFGRKSELQPEGQPLLASG